MKKNKNHNIKINTFGAFKVLACEISANLPHQRWKIKSQQTNKIRKKRENFGSLGVVKEINEKWMNWILIQK